MAAVRARACDALRRRAAAGRDDAARPPRSRRARARREGSPSAHRRGGGDVSHTPQSDDEEWKSSFVQGDDAALTAAIKAREAECDPLLRRGPSGGAVKQRSGISLADPPYATRTAAVKDAATELVCKCMPRRPTSTRRSARSRSSSRDVLMKYIYRGCARAQFWRRPASRAPAPPAAARPHRALPPPPRRLGLKEKEQSHYTFSSSRRTAAVMKKAGQASIA